MSTTIRVSSKTHRALKRIAAKEKTTLQEVIESLLERFRREQFLEEMNRGFATLRKDPKAWAEELKERKLFENAVEDDLTDD